MEVNYKICFNLQCKYKPTIKNKKYIAFLSYNEIKAIMYPFEARTGYIRGLSRIWKRKFI